jgi:hypothetical protein
MSRGGLVLRQSASGVDEPTCGWCGCGRTQCESGGVWGVGRGRAGLAGYGANAKYAE